MTQIYIVIVDSDVTSAPEASEDLVILDQGLYLVRTSQSRSELYHAVKRRLAPRKLVVAPLSDMPKFKGLAPRSTTFARRLFTSPKS